MNCSLMCATSVPENGTLSAREAALHGHEEFGGKTHPRVWMASQASPVMVEEHVDHIFEEVRLLWGEEATLNLVNGLLQLGEPVVVLLGIVPGGKGLM